MKVDGASIFRRLLVTPFLAVGAATLACDHLPLNSDPSRRDAYGSVHKGNALNGARFVLENREPFGRGMRGASHMHVDQGPPRVSARQVQGRQDARQNVHRNVCRRRQRP